MYNKKCNIQISPLIFYPARLLSTCLLHRLKDKEAMCAAISTHKTTTTVCLGFFLHTSSMGQSHKQTSRPLKKDQQYIMQHCILLFYVHSLNYKNLFVKQKTLSISLTEFYWVALLSLFLLIPASCFWRLGAEFGFSQNVNIFLPNASKVSNCQHFLV